MCKVRRQDILQDPRLTPSFLEILGPAALGSPVQTWAAIIFEVSERLRKWFRLRIGIMSLDRLEMSPRKTGRKAFDSMYVSDEPGFSWYNDCNHIDVEFNKIPSHMFQRTPDPTGRHIPYPPNARCRSPLSSTLSWIGRLPSAWRSLCCQDFPNVKYFEPIAMFPASMVPGNPQGYSKERGPTDCVRHVDIEVICPAAEQRWRINMAF